MKDADRDKSTETEIERISKDRREFLKSAGVATAATTMGVSSALAGEPGATQPEERPQNPYGGGPNTGITLPPYYRPTPSVANANTFYPGMEELGDDEMRISFVGSSPEPPTRAQAGTAIMVELGNGKRFFFDWPEAVEPGSSGILPKSGVYRKERFKVSANWPSTDLVRT